MTPHVQQLMSDQSVDDRRAIPVVVLGLLVGVGPILYVPFPGDGGPITFIVRALQIIAFLFGVCIMGIGYHSYRTGKIRIATAIGSSTVGVAAVVVLGRITESSVGLLIPFWTWITAITVVVGLSVMATFRLTDPNP